MVAAGRSHNPRRTTAHGDGQGLQAEFARAAEGLRLSGGLRTRAATEIYKAAIDSMIKTGIHAKFVAVHLVTFILNG